MRRPKGKTIIDDNLMLRMYHFTRWKFSYLLDLWIISSKRRGSEQIIPMHKTVEHLDDNVTEFLPALDAPIGILILNSMSHNILYCPI